MLFLSLFVSAILVAAVALVYRFSRGTAIGVALAFVIPVACIDSSVALLNWGLLTVAAVVACAGNWKPRTFAISALGASLVAYAALTPGYVRRHRELDALRAEYPIQSLRARLAYERPSRGADDELPTEGSGTGSAAVVPAVGDIDNRKLELLEAKFDQSQHTTEYRTRSRALPALLAAHERQVDDFINAEGFGVGRSRGLPARREYIDLPEPGPLALEAAPPADNRQSAEETEDDASPVVVATVGGQGAEDATGLRPLADFHTDGIINFSNAAGFGYMEHGWQDGKSVANLDRVIGFQAHAFRSRPEPPSLHGTSWQIAELQLVSLLKHETSVAYVSGKLPRMEELRDNPTRPLTSFEATALERLRAGEDLVVSEQRNTIDMLGSVRALRQCLDCHQVDRGALLGAFSYRLRREPAQAAPPAAKPAGKSLSSTAGQPARRHKRAT